MLGIKISGMRKARGLSLVELAVLSGLSAETLHAVETGRIFPVELNLLLRIADNLELKNASGFMELMNANKPLSFEAYNVGIGKTGTLSIAAIFGNYRSRHQFLLIETFEMIRKFEQNEKSKKELCDFIVERDRSGCLEMDSSGHHYFYLKILVDEFPEAKFIFVIRDCYSWFDSVINMLHLPNGGFGSPGAFDFDRLKPVCRDKERLLRELPDHIDGPLEFWASANRKALDNLPPDRSLIVRTNEISDRLDTMADFIGVPVETLIREHSHVHKAAKKLDILKAADPKFLERKFNSICSPLMREFFPSYSLTDYLNREPVPPHPKL